MKILIHNVGYFLGHNGLLLDYFKHSHRYISCNPKIRAHNLEQFRNLLATHDPDICGLIEIRENTAVLEDLSQNHSCTIVTKYGTAHPLRALSAKSANSNAVLSREVLAVKTHYLSCGNKRLVLETEKNGVNIFFVHLSLRKHIRQRQLRELQTLIADKLNVIVCGDFNIFGGFAELELFLRQTNLQLVSQAEDYTFPAARPTKAIDIFLCSTQLKVISVHVLDIVLSDHLPVLLEVDDSAV